MSLNRQKKNFAEQPQNWGIKRRQARPRAAAQHAAAWPAALPTVAKRHHDHQNDRRVGAGPVAADKFAPAGFKLPLGLKDNRLLLAAAGQVAAPMPPASLVHDRFLAAMAQGLDEADWAAIARISYHEAGLS